MTGGEAHDCPVAERLIRSVKSPKRMLGDKAYDSAELREELDERGTKPVIPNRSNRKQPFSFSKRLYKLRWRIESAFNRLKDFRRIATRYDRLARNYLASVCLVASSCMVDLISLDPRSTYSGLLVLVSQECSFFERIPLMIDKAAGMSSFCAATSKGFCTSWVMFAFTPFTSWPIPSMVSLRSRASA